MLKTGNGHIKALLVGDMVDIDGTIGFEDVRLIFQFCIIY
jgi:hypothetical protein